MSIAYLALGSNEGDRIVALQRAVDGLAQASVAVRRVSPVYRTEAHTLDPAEAQADYFNAVVEVETEQSPEDVLDLAKRLERRAGRDLSDRRWAPRPLDVDLLTVGEETRDTAGLTLPHPRLAERRFVLRPWADLAPNLVVPAPFATPVARLLVACCDDGAMVQVPTALRLPNATFSLTSP